MELILKYFFIKSFIKAVQLAILIQYFLDFQIILLDVVFFFSQRTISIINLMRYLSINELKYSKTHSFKIWNGIL